MFVDFLHDLPLVRDYVARRVREQALVGDPISAIEVGFRLSQACLVGLNFDTRVVHVCDGTCYKALEETPLEMQQWNEAFEAATTEGIDFVLLSGERHEIPAPGAGEEVVAAVFGEALLAITLDAIAAGMFDPLPLREDCQLDLEEFDGMWAWPSGAYDPEAVERRNEIRLLTPTKIIDGLDRPQGAGQAL